MIGIGRRRQRVRRQYNRIESDGLPYPGRSLPAARPDPGVQVTLPTHLEALRFNGLYGKVGISNLTRHTVTDSNGRKSH